MGDAAEPFWFRPERQRNAEAPVEFLLRPLDQAAKLALTVSISKNGALLASDFESLLVNHVIDWRGIGGPCTPERRRELLDTEPAGDWNVWIQEIAVRLYIEKRSEGSRLAPTGCGCCAHCLSELADHWFSDLWRYCPHNKAMSVRRAGDAAWTITKGVKPKRAAAHLAAAVSRMQVFAKQNGLDLSVLDRQISDLRRRDREAD